jgi:guanylate kinase
MLKKGNVFIVSAPSGSGKSTLVERLLQQITNLKFSISYTTRQPRGTEQNGVEYNFVTPQSFEEMIREDQFIEHARVHEHYYGTAQQDIERAQQAGFDIILDIDTAGARQVKQKLPNSISIFIFPPSYQALKERLFQRQSDAPEVIEKRLKWAAETEIHRFQDYDYVVVNDVLGESLDILKSIITAERARTGRMASQIQSIIQTFGGGLR